MFFFKSKVFTQYTTVILISLAMLLSSCNVNEEADIKNIENNLSRALRKTDGDVALSKVFGDQWDKVCLIISDDSGTAEDNEAYLRQFLDSKEYQLSEFKNVRQHLLLINKDNKNLLSFQKLSVNNMTTYFQRQIPFRTNDRYSCYEFRNSFLVKNKKLNTIKEQYFILTEK